MQDAKEKRKEFQRRYDEFDQQLPRCCQNCSSVENLTIHHIVPLVLGGNNVIGNLVRLCDECHSKIHGKKSVHNRELQRKGIEEAKKRGAFKGGKPRYTIEKENVKQALLLFHQRKERKLSIVEIAKRMNMSRNGLYDLVKRYPLETTPELQEFISREKRAV